MGAWYFLRARFNLRRIKCICREESASPATGSAAAHKIEQQRLVDEAFA
jgi:2-oxoglutarate dehydrogenase complex dehydrogenase (E1) component-like enzyme